MSQIPRLRLGFVGARTLNDGDESWLKERFKEIWEYSHKAVPNYDLRLTSGLAHGADRIAINSFLDWRGNDAHELLAIYPCDPEQFRDSSDIHDKEKFDAQRKAILADNRGAELVLDGSLPRGAPKDSAKEAREKSIRAAAYTYQSEALIRQSEFLIAVLDRNQPGKIGGTRSTVLNAFELDTPVLILDPNTRSCFLLCYPDELCPEYKPKSSTSWQHDWDEALRQNTSTLPDPQSQDDQINGIEALYNNAPPNTHPLTSKWEVFYSVFQNYATRKKESSNSKDKRSTPAFVSAVLRFLSTVGMLLRALLTICFRNRPGETIDRKHNLTVEAWRGHISDHQAKAMGAYRGIFLVNYLLGLGAIILALCSLSILALTDLKPGIWEILVLVALTALKLWVVSQIKNNTEEAETKDYNNFAISSRYIAERLRVMPVIFQTGSSRVDLLHQSPRQGKPHDITKDLCRRIPLSDCAIKQNSKAALTGLHQLIDSQHNYHWKTHITMQAMYQILEHAVRLVGRAIICIVVIDILLLASKLILKSGVLNCFLSAEILATTGSWLGIAGLIAVVLTALLPSIMATLNAILFQSQAEQLAKHHDAMANALKKLANKAHQLESDLNSNHFETRGSHAVLTLAERTAKLMAEEVAEWATMYRQDVKET